MLDFVGYWIGSELNTRLRWVMKALYCDRVPSKSIGVFNFGAWAHDSIGAGARIAGASANRLFYIPFVWPFWKYKH